MLMGGGVKKSDIFADVLNGSPLITKLLLSLSFSREISQSPRLKFECISYKLRCMFDD